MLDLIHRKELEPLAEAIQALRHTGGVEEWLVVGAMARDLQLGIRFGIPIPRATKDMDFAVAVPDWDTYLQLRERLLASGLFSPNGQALHALRFKGAWFIDLIPFGRLMRPDNTLAWPPDENPVMSLLGFTEAWDSSIHVQLPGHVRVRVASIPALALLKLIAWRERRLFTRGKDAEDFMLLLKTYLEAGQMDRLYTEADHLFDQPNFDLDRSGAWLLGKDARVMTNQSANQSMQNEILALLETETRTEGSLHLAAEMSARHLNEALGLLQAFHAGFAGNPHP